MQPLPRRLDLVDYHVAVTTPYIFLRLNAETHLTNPNGGRLHILVVEDDRDTAESMAILLRCYGHRVQVASDGSAACQVALSKPPDVVLLDLVLPGTDGWEVARRFQEPT